MVINVGVDIRRYTRVIICKNRRYLQCRSAVTNELIWSESPYHAWWTRNAEDARNIAKATGGTAMLFNPVVGMEVVL